MKRRGDEVLDLGRFSEPALLIMISLADGPKHGYAMTSDITELTGTRPGPGTLYGAIARLEERRMIEPVGTDDRRTPYRLTALGMKILLARLSAIEAMVRSGRRRLAHA